VSQVHLDLDEKTFESEHRGGGDAGEHRDSTLTVAASRNRHRKQEKRHASVMGVSQSARVPKFLIALLLAASLLAGAADAFAQPQGVGDPTAPENLRCPGPNLPFDPNTQQIVYVWQNVVAYPQSLDDQGPKGVALDRNCNLYIADSETNHVIKVSPSGDT
jgi:hypothetical protein